MGKKENVRSRKRGKRKTNKDEKRGLHPNTQPSVFSSWLDSLTHEVEVLGTLHSSMRRGLNKGKKWDNTAASTLIEVTTNTMTLKHTGLWLTIEGWADVADIDKDKVFDTKPSHSRPPHPTTKPPPFHPNSFSNSNLLPSPHSITVSTSLLCKLCACHTAIISQTLNS